MELFAGCRGPRGHRSFEPGPSAGIFSRLFYGAGLQFGHSIYSRRLNAVFVRGYLINRQLIRGVSCLLVPLLIGGDPAWAAGISDFLHSCEGISLARISSSSPSCTPLRATATSPVRFTEEAFVSPLLFVRSLLDRHRRSQEIRGVGAGGEISIYSFSPYLLIWNPFSKTVHDFVPLWNVPLHALSVFASAPTVFPILLGVPFAMASLWLLRGGLKFKTSLIGPARAILPWGWTFHEIVPLKKLEKKAKPL